MYGDFANIAGMVPLVRIVGELRLFAGIFDWVSPEVLSLNAASRCGCAQMIFARFQLRPRFPLPLSSGNESIRGAM